MDDLIDDALTLAREGRAVEERVFVALDDLARDAWRTSRTAAATLTVTAPEGTRVYADGDRLLRLFENLFRNAIDHGPEDVTVRVGLLGDATDADGGFYVEDTGPGIPVDERETVFEHGYTTSADGTGLGLAIVESVAEAHGWTVTAAESPEGGARFVFEGAEVDVVSRAPGDAVAEDRDGGDGGELLIEEG
jgi:signal transduction histidine kinase